ncbi:MAG: rRNA maturation RNase YbeY [Candidatus Acidiferrales bacterium]
MILNRQRQVRISVDDLEKFSARVRKLLKIPADAITVCLVSSADIAKWNRAYRGKNKPTDVLSFTTDEPSVKRRIGKLPRKRTSAKSDVDDATPYWGDIAIAPAIARQNARRFGREFNDEMRILILHGMLHLMGYDHETDNGQMDRREMRLRRQLGLVQ